MATEPTLKDSTFLLTVPSTSHHFHDGDSAIVADRSTPLHGIPEPGNCQTTKALRELTIPGRLRDSGCLGLGDRRPRRTKNSLPEKEGERLHMLKFKVNSSGDLNGIYDVTTQNECSVCPPMDGS
ncbi:uncharacterized protein LOC143211137 [Lasioglossum baleicum]|uniref:uncharacterized protein LOC143211137 n=1 Tax=Lasioglossum baleicum TaxID=434251 RepID=UPI003FCE3C93